MKNWWWLTINGVSAIIFGMVAIFYPSITLVLLLAYFGMLALFLGAFFMLGGFLNRKQTKLWDFWFFEGTLHGIIGLILLFYGDITLPMFQVLLSLWAILVGTIQIITVLRMWDEVYNRSLYLINGSLALVFGTLIIVIPFEGVENLTLFIGAYTMALGIFSILISISMKKVKSQDLRNDTRIYTYHHQ